MFESSGALEKIIKYMKAHWPSKVKPEWQVELTKYAEILPKVMKDFTAGVGQGRRFMRIAGLSGSGKTTQILPAVEAYCSKNKINFTLVAARRFVEYHPHHQEIREFYGEENLRKMTDEFATIMMFLCLSELIRNGYDIVLDVTLLDPEMEAILLKMLEKGKYESLLLMIATSPTVTEKFLEGRNWRHTKETELEFVRATDKALKFYADEVPEFKIIMWSVYDLLPVYDGPVKNCLKVFEDYSKREELPKKDDEARRKAKIEYLCQAKVKADLN